MNDKQFIFTDDIRANPRTLRSFYRLAGQVFGLDLRAWARGGWWDDRYIPHALLRRGRVAANVSVSVVDVLQDGVLKRYAQLGTIMTAPDERGRGLSRQVMERVLAEWTPRCDGIYLYAHDGVRDFYPRFGFFPMEQRQYRGTVERCALSAHLLAPTKRADRQLLLDCYARSNPWSALSMEQNPGWLMFYCTQKSFQHSIWYLEKARAVVIAAPQGEAMLCYDVYGGGELPLKELLGAVLPRNSREVLLGFTPKDTEGWEAFTRREQDETFFVLEGKECPGGMLPLLSYA